MQSVDHNGLLGKVQAFKESGMEKMLQDPKIDHVDVFDGTLENIRHRKSLEGKKYKPSNGFKKAPRVNSKKR